MVPLCSFGGVPLERTEGGQGNERIRRRRNDLSKDDTVSRAHIAPLGR